RTLWNVLWSCLTTIFASTWLAVHPNVPGRRITKGEGPWILSTREHLKVMAMALIAPEIIVAWAATQFTEFSISSIRKLWRRKDPQHLTMAHGFMVSMGGLDGRRSYTKHERGSEEYREHVSEEKELLLSLDALREYPELRMKLQAIKIEDIMDRSKGDALSKTISILQISWFMVQCFARINQNLPITLLEITALAFAGLSIITYCLWWHKPLNVNY
ncbi:hypothetical protein IW262DRAFT_1242668, partial [Armillaria fumosa]